MVKARCAKGKGSLPQFGFKEGSKGAGQEASVLHVRKTTEPWLVGEGNENCCQG